MQNTIQSAQSGRNWIQESISKGLICADICSAYIRSEAFRYFFKDTFKTDTKIRVLARWAPGDLIAQASDLLTYGLCKKNNIDFYIKQDFHGKIYCLAPHGILLGSFNLTNRGFSISNNGNDEAGTLLKINDGSVDYFEQLFSSARKVDDNLYNKISSFVEANISTNSIGITWPDEIEELIKPTSNLFLGKILVNECFMTTFNDFYNLRSEFRLYDLSLLSINEQQSKDLTLVRARFRNTKIFKWFVSSLHQQKEDVFFGKATALLHDQLFDDPKPYRQEVKNLLVNLLSWIEGLKLEEISIDRPSHSQRIKLAK